VVGAGWLGWACQARQELRRALAERPSPGAAEETRRPAATLAAVWLLAALLFALALSSRTAHWGDAFALTAALGGFTTFQRGSLGQPGAG